MSIIFINFVIMKAKRSDLEFYQNMIDMLQQEKATFASLLEVERASAFRREESFRQETAALRETVAELTEQLRKKEAVETGKDNQIRELMKLVSDLNEKLSNALASGALARGKRFAPTSEKTVPGKADQEDVRAKEKDDFDGTPPPAATPGTGALTSADVAGAASSKESTPKVKKKSQGRKQSLENYECDEVVVHELEEYFELPEGAVYKTRNGKIEMHEYVSIEFLPAKVVKHVWKTATYMDATGDSHNTLPVEERPNPVAGCPFSAEMLAFIMMEKYGYNTPKNRIKTKLREMGAKFSKSTFVRYYRLAIGELRKLLEDTMHKAILEGNYLMVDETCELVGVIDENTNIPEYKKRYLWAFHDKASKLVSYLYEKGSRARDVLLDFIKGFKGTLSTDGYAAYQIFDGEGYPDILHCGCWAHVRRKFKEAMDVATEACMDILQDINALFVNEQLFAAEKTSRREKKRKKLSRPIVNRIFDRASLLAKDTVLMGRDLFKKAVNYLMNQEQSLRNFLKDGKAELSNNLCEQQMKPIKLDLKNCQNIGSEDAARDSAFMHSMVQSCRLNGKNPYQYLLHLFRNLKEPLDDIRKRNLLPDRWMSEPEMLKS